MEFQVRDARITDVDGITTLLAMSGAVDGVADGAVDLLRRMLYLPQAALLVAESNRRVVGFGVLTLSSSIRRGGTVGTIDLLVVDRGPMEQSVADALLAEMVRSARRKGCVVVEAAAPEGTMEQHRWEEQGFDSTRPRLELDLGRVRAGRP
jgi:N-acetylglutamate synthase-like GNAT family acetyltransferase